MMEENENHKLFPVSTTYNWKREYSQGTYNELIKNKHLFPDLNTSSLDAIAHHSTEARELIVMLKADPAISEMFNYLASDRISLNEFNSFLFILHISPDIYKRGVGKSVVVMNFFLDYFKGYLPTITPEQLAVVFKQFKNRQLTHLISFEENIFSPIQILKSKLYLLIESTYELSAFYSFAKKFGVDYENLTGARSSQIQQFIDYLIDQHRVEELLSAVLSDRSMPNSAQEVGYIYPHWDGKERDRGSDPSATSIQKIEAAQILEKSQLVADLNEFLAKEREKDTTQTIGFELAPTEQIFNTAIVTNSLSLAEGKGLVGRYTLSLEDMEVWAYFLTKSSVYKEQFQSYKDLISGDQFNFYRIDAILCKILYYGQRHSMRDLKKSFYSMLDYRQQMLHREGAVHTHERKIVNYMCSACSSSTPILMKQGMGGALIPELKNCGNCGSNQLTPEEEKTSSVAELDFETLKNIITGADNFTDVARYLVDSGAFDEADLYLWASRVMLYFRLSGSNLPVSKMPFENIPYFKEKSLNNKIVSFLIRAEKIGVPRDVIANTVQAKEGNRISASELAEKQTQVCFCADCGDVFLSPIEGVSLTSISTNDLYDTQVHEIKPPVCKNEDCLSGNVFLSADFSNNLDEQFAKIIQDPTNENKIELFILQHFSIQEMINLMIYFSNKYSLSEDISYENATDMARELISWAKRRSKLAVLIQEILKYKFESSVAGLTVAIQCGYCNTVHTTRFSNEGMVLLGYCTSCAAIDGWKVYQESTGKRSTIVPRDLYNSYLLSLGRDGTPVVLPPLVHYAKLFET